MEIEQKSSGLVTASVILIAVVAAAFTLHTISGILLPLVLAGFLSMMFKPLVHLLRGWRVPMPIVLAVVLAIAAGAFWLMYLIISLGVTQFDERSAFYAGQLKHVLTDIEATIAHLMRSIGRRATFKLDALVTSESTAAFATGQLQLLLNMASSGVMVLLYLVFMIAGSEAFPGKIRAAFLGGKGAVVLEIFETVSEKVRTYLAMKTLFNLANGIIAWIILEMFGVDFAPLIGLLTFLFHYIPNVGSVITTVIPGLVFLLQTGSVAHSAGLTLVLVVVQNVIGNIIEPKVLGDKLSLSPVVVLFSLLFWGWMWGIVGMILSVPIMSSLKMALELLPITRPIGVLMGSSVVAHSTSTEQT